MFLTPKGERTFRIDTKVGCKMLLQLPILDDVDAVRSSFISLVTRLGSTESVQVLKKPKIFNYECALCHREKLINQPVIAHIELSIEALSVFECGETSVFS